MCKRKVAVIGCGMTKFGRHDEESLLELISEASLAAIENAEINEKEIETIYVSSMFAGQIDGQSLIATALADRFGLYSAAADRIENGTASGASAVRNACLAVMSGICDVSLVVGGEKMISVPRTGMTNMLSTMNHLVEYAQGATMPALAAMFTKLYMKKYGVSQKHLAMVAVKNHLNALKNPYAHLHKKITVEELLYSEDSEKKNPVIAEPLRLYDCCPISDGSAAIIICEAEKAKKICEKPVLISGFGYANDNLRFYEREDPTVLSSLRKASQQAFKMAGLTPKDIDVVELHEAFTILEIAESEDAGFFEKGTGHKALEEELTALNGEIPINPSGGLKARGHPIGATGIAQLVELTLQLRGEVRERQVPNAEKAFSCNSGGLASNMIVFILERGD